MKKSALLALCLMTPSVFAGNQTGSILIIEDSFNGVGGAARQGLDDAGWSVTSTTTMPTSFDGFDQVWDVRYLGAITEDQRGMYASYLQSGGRMLLTGENNGQSFRNSTIFQTLQALGAGQIGIQNTSWDGMQDVTDAGSSIFDFARMQFDSASLYTSAGNGELLTAISDDPTRGAIAGWGVGSMTDALNGAVISALDVNFFFAEHTRGTSTVSVMMANALASGVVPAPSTSMLALAAIGYGARRRR